MVEKNSKQIKPPYAALYMVLDKDGNLIANHNSGFKIYTPPQFHNAKKLHLRHKGSKLVSFMLTDGIERDFHKVGE